MPNESETACHVHTFQNRPQRLHISGNSRCRLPIALGITRANADMSGFYDSCACLLWRGLKYSKLCAIKSRLLLLLRVFSNFAFIRRCFFYDFVSKMVSEWLQNDHHPLLQEWTLSESHFWEDWTLVVIIFQRNGQNYLLLVWTLDCHWVIQPKPTSCAKW